MTDATAPRTAAAAPAAPRARGPWRDVWDQFRTHKGALIAGAFLLATSWRT